MNITYLNNTPWLTMSREERLYCAEFYFHYRNNTPSLLRLLQQKVKCIDEDELSSYWELGYEVCFYRDYINHFKKQLYRKDVFKIYPRKRTFDLCLFSQSKIVIIEAKVHQRFDTKQNEAFAKDEQFIRLLFEEAKHPCPEIITIGLARSSYLKKEKHIPNMFRNKCFSWDDVYQQTQLPIFKQADG